MYVHAIDWLAMPVNDLYSSPTCNKEVTIGIQIASKAVKMAAKANYKNTNCKCVIYIQYHNNNKTQETATTTTTTNNN